jgi:hypothetical protein
MQLELAAAKQKQINISIVVMSIVMFFFRHFVSASNLDSASFAAFFLWYRNVKSMELKLKHVFPSTNETT